MNALTFTAPQVALIRKTVAKDCDQNEFDLFIEMCKARGLNPLLRHCYAFVFSKDNPKFRNMVVVVSIDGQRYLAESTGAYRPDEHEARFENGTTKDPLSNPLGLSSAAVTVYKYVHGAWHPVTEKVYWEETAPLEEFGNEGKLRINPKKDAWKRMPRRMLAKCAEMAALRKAFPGTFSGLYAEAEMDRAEIIDITPSEAADEAERQDRFAKIGGAQGLIIDWLDGNELQRVLAGQFADRCMAFLKQNEEEPMTIRAFQDRNKHALREFWALSASDALAVKKEMERLTAMEVANAP